MNSVPNATGPRQANLSQTPSPSIGGSAPEPPTLVDAVTSALTAIGVGAGVIAEARQTIAAGQTYTSFAQAVRDQNNEDLLPVVDCLAEVIGRVANRQSLKPLISAIERIKAEENAAEIGHYPWCDGDITYPGDDGKPVIEHVGPRIDMPLPDDMDCRSDQLLSANLSSHDEYTGEPVVSYNSGGNGVLLDRAQLDQVIADHEAFTDGLRNMRHLMDMERAA